MNETHRFDGFEREGRFPVENANRPRPLIVLLAAKRGGARTSQRITEGGREGEPGVERGNRSQEHEATQEEDECGREKPVVAAVLVFPAPPPAPASHAHVAEATTGTTAIRGAAATHRSRRRTRTTHTGDTHKFVVQPSPQLSSRRSITRR